MLWYARVQTKSASCAGCSGTICRSNENTTASASNGVPSWKRTLGRSSKVQMVPSELTVQLVARSASGSRRPAENRTSRPYTCSATSSDSMSLVRAGSRLTASVGRATTSRSDDAPPFPDLAARPTLASMPATAHRAPRTAPVTVILLDPARRAGIRISSCSAPSTRRRSAATSAYSAGDTRMIGSSDSRRSTSTFGWSAPRLRSRRSSRKR